MGSKEHPTWARITGTGSYLPERVLTNQDLEKMVETSDEWIVSRTGIKERRIAGANEHNSDMAIAAGRRALDKAGIGAEQLDLIIIATLTPDYLFPNTAALVQKALGATSAATFDFQVACSGFIYGLSIAKAFIESGMYKNILLIASEKLSSVTNYEDRNTCVLFGDGAAAAVIRNEGPGLRIRHACLGADGEQAELLIQPAGGSRLPASLETVQNRKHFVQMEGKEVFKHAVRRMENAAKECLDVLGLKDSDISWLVPHQANLRIIDAIAKRFNVAKERVYLTIHKYGNTSASSVPIALDELIHEHEVKEGDNLLLIAFGSGLTWGASILTQISR